MLEGMTSEALTAPVIRADGRTPDQLRPISITRGWSKQAEGSALIEFGNTRVLCTASLTEGVQARLAFRTDDSDNSGLLQLQAPRRQPRLLALS